MNIFIGCGIIISLFCTSHAMDKDYVWIKTTNKEISKMDKNDAKNSLLITLVMQQPKKSISDEDRGTLSAPIQIHISKPELQLLNKARLSEQPTERAQQLLKKWKSDDYYTLLDTTEKLKAPVFYAALVQALLLPELSTKIAQMYLPFVVFRRQLLQKRLQCFILEISNRTPSRKLLLEHSHSNSLPSLPLIARHKKNHKTVLQIPNKNFRLKAGNFYIQLLDSNGNSFAKQIKKRDHQQFTDMYGTITCIAVHPHGTCCAVGFQKGIITLWMLPKQIGIPGTIFCIAGVSRFTSKKAISHLELSENNMLLSHSDRTILWDIELWNTKSAALIDMGIQAKSLLVSDGSSIITISHKKNTQNSEFLPLIENIRTLTTWDLRKKEIDIAYAKLTLLEALQLGVSTYVR